MFSINTKRLRKDLCGKDKLPRGFEISKRVPCYDMFGNELGEFEVDVTLQYSLWEPHPAGHRLYVKCPECSKKVSAGRIAQHFKVHE